MRPPLDLCAFPFQIDDPAPRVRVSVRSAEVSQSTQGSQREQFRGLTEKCSLLGDIPVLCSTIQKIITLTFR